MHPIMLLALVLVAAVGLTQVPRVQSAPDVPAVAAAAAPSQKPQPVSVVPQPVAEAVAAPKPDAQPVEVAQKSTAEIGATPKVEPHPVEVAPKPTAETVATPMPEPQPVEVAEKPAAEAAAIPNHDPPHLRPAPSFALNVVTLQAGPEPAAPQAPAAPKAATFVAADTTLYAKPNARLRAAPSTAADVVTKLTADAPLRADGRSSDGAWWRVSLDGGRAGYIHRTAVTKNRMVATKAPAAEPAPVATAARPQPVPASRSQGLLGTVEETMDWFVDTASRGKPPTINRSER
jgi:hypothetical protein